MTGDDLDQIISEAQDLIEGCNKKLEEPSVREVYINGLPVEVKDIKCGDIFKIDLTGIDCNAVINAYLYYDQVSWIVDFTNENLPEGYLQSVVDSGDNMYVTTPVQPRKPLKIDEDRMNKYVTRISNEKKIGDLTFERYLKGASEVLDFYKKEIDLLR